MRRRSERKKSSDITSPSPSTRRSNRRSKKSPTHSPECLKEEEQFVVPTEEVIEEESINKVLTDTVSDRDCEEKTRRGRRRKSSTPHKSEVSSPLKKGKREFINEVIVEEENKSDSDSNENLTIVNTKTDSNSNKTPDSLDQVSGTEIAKPIVNHQESEESCTPQDSQQDETIPASDNIENDSEDSIDKNNLVSNEINEVSPDCELVREQHSTQCASSAVDTKNEPAPNVEDNSVKVETNSLYNHIIQSEQYETECILASQDNQKYKDHPSHFDQRTVDQDEKENEKEKKTEKPIENSSESIKEKTKSHVTKKRKWLTQKSTDLKPQILAISTDSLKNLISDVHPVPLSDVRLGSSPEPENIYKPEQRESYKKSSSPQIFKEVARNREKDRDRDFKRSDDKGTSISLRRTSTAGVSNHNEKTELQKLPSPPKNESSSVLFITNLVRPFTVLQLKGLLARTGVIVENGFWIDHIKSKCYVKYETEDEAIETRHALHGVRWPSSNPKCLNVDFGSEIAMKKALSSTSDDIPKYGLNTIRDNRIVGTGWDRERFDFDEKKDNQVSRPVREWDMGKKEELESDKRDREVEEDKERIKDRQRRHRSKEVEVKRSTSGSPARKYKKKENDPPLRLLDDLFRKTKTTPCIYWLPLTPEQIAEKEEIRQKRLEEHAKLVKEREREREKEREKEREREREREKERERRRGKERSGDRRRSRSRKSNRRRY